MVNLYLDKLRMSGSVPGIYQPLPDAGKGSYGLESKRIPGGVMFQRRLPGRGGETGFQTGPPRPFKIASTTTKSSGVVTFRFS